MPKFKSVVDSFIEFFTAEEKEFEYELLIPTEVEKKVQESIPTVVQESAKPTLLLRAAEPITQPAAEPSPVSPVKGPLFEAEEALEESLKRLSFIENQAALAAQEAAILAEVHEVNRLIRKTVVEMGDQRLLPRDMEQRREAVAAEDADILEMFKDLGF